MKRVRRTPYGQRFIKPDLDRVGFFDDPSEAPFDFYHGVPFEFRAGVQRYAQMSPGPPLPLFEEKFHRIFDCEPYVEPWRLELKKQLQREQGKIAGRMMPPSPSKKHATPGDWHGCFHKPTYLSPLTRPVPRKRPGDEPPNMKIKPNPTGGPGFGGITIHPFPSHIPEPYDKKKEKVKQLAPFLSVSAPSSYFTQNPYLDENPGPTYLRPVEVKMHILGPPFQIPFPKDPGGNHDGCFHKFPSHMTEPYEQELEVKETEEEPPPIFVSGGPARRAKYTNSIIEQITRRSCNINNYLEYRERAYPLRK